jgi:hypothetical protein
MSYSAVIVGSVAFNEVGDNIRLSILDELKVLTGAGWVFDGASWTVEQFQHSSSLKGREYLAVYERHKKHFRDFYVSLYILTEGPDEELYFDQGRQLAKKLSS